MKRTELFGEPALEPAEGDHADDQRHDAEHRRVEQALHMHGPAVERQDVLERGRDPGHGVEPDEEVEDLGLGAASADLVRDQVKAVDDRGREETNLEGDAEQVLEIAEVHVGRRDQQAKPQR